MKALQTTESLNPRINQTNPLDTSKAVSVLKAKLNNKKKLCWLQPLRPLNCSWKWIKHKSWGKKLKIDKLSAPLPSLKFRRGGFVYLLRIRIWRKIKFQIISWHLRCSRVSQIVVNPSSNRKRTLFKESSLCD